MRREMFRMSDDEALALLARAPFVHLAGVDEEGSPVLRALHVVVVDGALCFHASPAGEKTTLLGRPVVLCAEEVIAEVPSYFSDAERACPATTLYRSAQVHGVVTAVDDVETKARVLQEIMRRYQPEGLHRPITHDDPMYAAAVRGLLVARVVPTAVDGKAKLAQNKKAEEVGALLERLWQRGAAGDARAVQLVRAANPSTTTPAFLAAPPGATLICACDHRHVDGAVALLASAYWNTTVSSAALATALPASSAWVAAVDDAGTVIGTARALSDNAKWATFYDVVVAETWRGHGVGSALVRLLLDHPAVRGAERVTLRTRDAQRVYAPFGFIERPSSTHPEMVLRRSAA